MDALLIALDSALRTVFTKHHANRPTPTQENQGLEPLSATQKLESIGLMRVNHVG